MTDEVKELIERLNILERNLLGKQYQSVRDTYLKAATTLTRLSEQNAKRQELDEVHKDTRGDFYSVYDELSASRNFLASEGYRRCDIAACNCCSWHDHSPKGYNGLNQKIDDLEEQNAKLKNTIQDLTTYTPEIIQQELAAKDARIAELEVIAKCNHNWLSYADADFDGPILHIVQYCEHCGVEMDDNGIFFNAAERRAALSESP